MDAVRPPRGGSDREQQDDAQQHSGAARRSSGTPAETGPDPRDGAVGRRARPGRPPRVRAGCARHARSVCGADPFLSRESDCGQHPVPGHGAIPGDHPG
ncbi:hypothetical protein HMPREF0682_1981, partial [Propionibacterium acidifaciens F0233]